MGVGLVDCDLRVTFSNTKARADINICLVVNQLHCLGSCVKGVIGSVACHCMSHCPLINVEVRARLT